MQQQLTHEETFFTEQKFPITLICDGITYQPNIGSVFRVCEAFGVAKVIFVGENIALTPRKINRTSRATHLQVPHQVATLDEAETFLQEAKDNSEIIALEITDKSKPLKDIALPKNKPIVLIAGGEVNGISEVLLKLANQTAHITMYGKNSSMNVVNAVGIALYEITGKIS